MHTLRRLVSPQSTNLVSILKICVAQVVCRPNIRTPAAVSGVLTKSVESTSSTLSWSSNLQTCRDWRRSAVLTDVWAHGLVLMSMSVNGVFAASSARRRVLAETESPATSGWFVLLVAVARATVRCIGLFWRWCTGRLTIVSSPVANTPSSSDAVISGVTRVFGARGQRQWSKSKIKCT